MTELRERVEVTQADRDAAADWLEKRGGYNMELTIRAIRQGDADGHACVQAFARHRLAVIAAVMHDLPIIGLWEDAASFRIRQGAWLAQYRKEQASE